MLELSFSSKELRSLCEDEIEAIAELGQEVATALQHRLADLRAASHPLDLPFGFDKFGTDTATAQLFVELVDGYRLVISPNHVDLPRTDDGRIWWERVSRILILRIEATRD